MGTEDRGRPSRRALLTTGSLGIVSSALPAAASATSSVTPASAPASPTVTAAPAGYLADGGSGTGRIEVGWDPVGGATSYLVRTSPAGTGTWSVGTSTTGTRLIVGGLADGDFDVEVTASNDAGASTPTLVEDVASVMATGGDQVSTFVGDGTIGVSGTRYVVHTFTSAVAATLTLRRAVDVECLVVGGGGGGGSGHAGGGGGGGGVVARSITAATGTVSVAVGAGGTGGALFGVPGQRRGQAGSASTLSASDGVTPTTVTAGGGGGGAAYVAAEDPSPLDVAGLGLDGASGGGGSGDSDSTGAGAKAGGTATGGGNAGGAASPGIQDYGAGGGGGGAASAGGDATYDLSATDGGDGGAGATSSITGESTVYGAGGGGGGWGPAGPPDLGRKGLGGVGGSSGAGGHGGPRTSGGLRVADVGDLDYDSNDAEGGAATTPGSGGGGSAARPYDGPGGYIRDGGAGAPGTVIVRYAVPA